MGRESRRSSRVPCELTVWVSTRRERIQAHAGDLSTTGMLLFPRSPLAVGERILLRLRLHGAEGALSGRVVRTARERTGHACGVEFEQVPAPLRRAIEELQATSGREPPAPEPSSLLELYQQALLQIDDEQRRTGRPRRRLRD